VTRTHRLLFRARRLLAVRCLRSAVLNASTLTFRDVSSSNKVHTEDMHSSCLCCIVWYTSNRRCSRSSL
jgi:hypothetical protein